MNTAFVCLSLLLEVLCAYVYIRSAVESQESKLSRLQQLLAGLFFGSIAILLTYYLVFV